MNNIIEARNVTKIFTKGIINKSETRAVNKISLNIESEKPMIRAIAGESGSGKTTLARMILGLTPPTEGKIYFENNDVSKLDTASKLKYRRSVQPIFQDPFGVFNPFYKVDRVLKMPIYKFKIAKKYSSDKSYKFINTILDKISKLLENNDKK